MRSYQNDIQNVCFKVLVVLGRKFEVVPKWVVVSNVLYFHPGSLGKIPSLTSIFFEGVETTNWLRFQSAPKL